MVCGFCCKRCLIIVAPVVLAFILWDLLFSDDEEDGRTRRDADGVDNTGWVASREQTPPVPGAPSKLVDFNWTSNVTCSVTPEQIEAFDRDGYALVKGVLDPEALDFILEEATRICEGQLITRKVCQIEQLRWQVNSFRDLMFYSALGCYAHQFIRGKGVRIATEALFGTQYNLINPHFFSYGFHTDTPGGHKGTYHGFTSRVRGASAWFPLHDLDDVAQGGSLNVLEGYPYNSDCRFQQCGGMILLSNPEAQAKANYDCSECWRWRPALRSFSFQKGDVLYFHPDMPHQTQPVIDRSFIRHSFTMRLVDTDSVLCYPAMACGDWMGCCRDIHLEPSHVIDNHCFPQIYPQVLDHEVAAHYSSTPKHLMGDLAWNDYVHTLKPGPDCA